MEHLSELPASSDGPQCTFNLRPSSEELIASTVSSAYSEDFTQSPSLTASEPMAHSEASSDRTLATSSEISASLRIDHPPPTCKAQKKLSRDVRRVIMKETAVQTLDPAFTYQWTKGKHMASGPKEGGAGHGSSDRHCGCTMQASWEVW